MKKPIFETETVEQAVARGVEIKRLPVVPTKGQRETKKSWQKRVNKQMKKADIEAEHIPAELRHLLTK